jgi:hypothetical protein
MATKERNDFSSDDVLASVEAGIQAGKVFVVPNDEDFSNNEYMDAPELEAIAAQHIAQYPDKFGWLSRVQLRYRWKRKGGKTKGKPSFGKTIPLSGLWFYEIDADYIITISADHVREFRFSQFQVEALMMHMLCYPKQTEDGDAGMTSPDVTEFSFVVEKCGLWEPSLQDFGKAVQLSFSDT